MVNYYSNNNQFESINFILDVFSSDIYESITWAMRPVVGTVDYLRSMHRLYQVQKELDQILRMDYDTREILMDALTDIVAINIYEEDLEKIDMKLENQISVLEDFDESFKKLKSFSSNLESKQQTELYRIVLRKLNGRLSSIRDEIRFKMWDENEDTKQLLILDQAFFLIQELIKEAIKKVNDADLWIMINVSLLRIEAFHRDKISFDDLQDDVTQLSMYNLDLDKIPRNYNAVFEVIGA